MVHMVQPLFSRKPTELSLLLGENGIGVCVLDMSKEILWWPNPQCFTKAGSGLRMMLS